MINWNNITYKSPEYLELKCKYQEKEVEVKTMNNRLSAIEEMLFDDGLSSVLDKFKKKTTNHHNHDFNTFSKSLSLIACTSK